MSKRSWFVAFALAAASCRRPPHDGNPGAANVSRGTVVARVGRVELREDDLERMMARDPAASPHRFDAAGARRELIEGMVRFELLAEAAERAGLMQDPDALHAQRQIAVTKLVNRTLGAVASPESISSADVAREYAARRATDFTLPGAARVRHIRVSAAPVAERLTAQAKALPSEDDAAFAALASKTTEDDLTRAIGGDLGFIDERSRLPAPVVTAALKLKTPGEIAGPIDTGSGYEILRLVSLRAPAVSPLSSVEEPIRQRLYRERRAKALDEFVAKLRAETPVEIEDAEPTALTRSP